MSGNTSYRRVPNAEDGSLPAPNTTERSSRGPRFIFGSNGGGGGSNRTRTRWFAIGGIAFVIFFILYLSSSPDSDSSFSGSPGKYAQRLRPSNWGSKGANPFLSSSGASIATHGDWNDQQFDQDGWVRGSGRKNLTYNSPFNRDDYSLTEDECDAFFPGLWTEIERSVEYYTTRQK